MSTALDTFTWTPVGEQYLPPEQRDKFVQRLAGVKWLTSTGKHPFSPAHGLMTVISEFGIRGVVEISYTVTWRIPEKPTMRYEDMPYQHPDYNVDAQVLGVKTRLGQAMWFLDMGHHIVPVALDTPEAT